MLTSYITTINSNLKENMYAHGKCNGELYIYIITYEINSIEEKNKQVIKLIYNTFLKFLMLKTLFEIKLINKI